MSCSEPHFVCVVAAGGDGSEDVANDAMQLLQIAAFKGLCRTIAALAENGLIIRWQIENIHDCMTTPLDDPDWRDDSFVASTQETLESILAQALKDTGDRDDNDGEMHVDE